MAGLAGARAWRVNVSQSAVCVASSVNKMTALRWRPPVVVMTSVKPENDRQTGRQIGRIKPL